eukprot:GHVQ01023143.1.p2 GENE.GHVQ01023143.1~~GHVQ01023143.1.p2  ORF type:complete len:109 (-),score=20.20 GHVQ01023143.1:321-647(-)
MGHRALGTLHVKEPSPDEEMAYVKSRTTAEPTVSKDYQKGESTVLMEEQLIPRPAVLVDAGDDNAEKQAAGRRGKEWQKELSFLSWHVQTPPGGDLEGVCAPRTSRCC